MKWSCLRNKFLNTEFLNKFLKSEIERKAYSKQYSYCIFLIRKAKHTFFGNNNTTGVTDNRKFLRTVKTVFSDKVTARSKTTLVEKEEVQKER